MSKALDTATAPALGTSITAGYEKRADGRRRPREPGARREDRQPARRSSRWTPGLKTFADGEVYCRYGESIRGADLFIVQSICRLTSARGSPPTTRSWSCC